MFQFSLFGIPIRIEPWFWGILVILFISSNPTAIGLICIVAAGAFSILVHEMGHALVGRYLGAGQPSIRLHGFGGETQFRNSRMRKKGWILTTAAGPAAGLLLALLAMVIHPAAKLALPEVLSDAVGSMITINLIWSLLNLLPILPLDGGKLLSYFLGDRNKKTVIITSLVAIVLLVPLALQYRLFFSLIILGYLAYDNWKMLQAHS